MFTTTTVSSFGTVWHERPFSTAHTHRAIAYGHNPRTGATTIECQCGRGMSRDSLAEARLRWAQHIEDERRREERDA